MLGASTTTYRRSMMFANDPGAVVTHIIFSAIDAMALTALVFLRKQFGERFYTIFKFGLAVSLLTFLMGLREMAAGLMQGAAFLYGGPLAMMATRGMMSGPARKTALFDATHLFYDAFLVVGGIQLVLVLLRSWRIGTTVPVHSKSCGQPLLSFGGRVNHWIATIFLEPIAVLFAGYVLRLCDGNLPTSYFTVLAIFLAISATHQWRLCRDDMLDEQDARLTAGFYADQVKHVAAGNKPSMLLGRIFLPFVVPRAPKLQLDVLRNWATRYREAANDTAPSPAVPSASVETSTKADAPPPPSAA